MSTMEVNISQQNLQDSRSTHRRPAFMKAPVSAPILSSPPPLTTEQSIDDLKPIGSAYDGTPVIVVPKDYQQIVAATFEAGMYGFDTESDCQNSQLRILQVYTGQTVYIFDISVFDLLTENLFVKFLRSKDRIKVGVDLDTDVFRIQNHFRNRKDNTPAWKRHKEKFTINGCIDIQSIAHSVGEKIMGLEKLGIKYVPGFTANPSNLGHYNPPTVEQYIYAANDAVVSLKIYKPLLTGQAVPLKNDINIDVIFDEYVEMFNDEEHPGSIQNVLRRIVETYPPWKDFSIEKRSSLGLRALGEISRRGYVSHFDIVQDIIWLSNKKWPPEGILEPVVEEPIHTPPPIENGSTPKSRKRSNKKKSKPRSKMGKSFDDIDAMVAEIDANTPKRTSPLPKSPVTAEGFRVQMMNAGSKKIYSMHMDPKNSASQIAEIVMKQIKTLDEIIACLHKGPIVRKSTIAESFTKTFIDKTGKIDPAFVQTLFPKNKTPGQDLINDSLEEMTRVECEMTDEIYRMIQDELVMHMVETKTLGASIAYTDFIVIVGEIIGVIIPKYSNGSKKILLANIFVHIALENEHLSSNADGDLRLGTVRS
jgi:hypothetical protein